MTAVPAVQGREVLGARTLLLGTVAKAWTSRRPGRRFRQNLRMLQGCGSGLTNAFRILLQVCMVNAVQAGSLVGDWNNQCTPEAWQSIPS